MLHPSAFNRYTNDKLWRDLTEHGARPQMGTNDDVRRHVMTHTGNRYVNVGDILDLAATDIWNKVECEF